MGAGLMPAEVVKQRKGRFVYEQICPAFAAREAKFGATQNIATTEDGVEIMRATSTSGKS
jgi:hypothetical protein